MNKEFSMNQIIWKETLIVNLIRSFIGGIVSMIFALVAMKMPISEAWLYIILFIVSNFIVFLPISLVLEPLKNASTKSKAAYYVFGLLGCCLLPAFIVFLITDPIVFIVYKISPALVPCEYKLFNWALFVFVLNEKNAANEEKI